MARAAACRGPQEHERSHDDHDDASDRADNSDRFPGTAARATRASPVRVVRLHDRLAAAVARRRRGRGHELVIQPQDPSGQCQWIRMLARIPPAWSRVSLFGLRAAQVLPMGSDKIYNFPDPLLPRATPGRLAGRPGVRS